MGLFALVSFDIAELTSSQILDSASMAVSYPQS